MNLEKRKKWMKVIAIFIAGIMIVSSIGFAILI